MLGMIDSWLPRRYAAVVRAQAREVDRSFLPGYAARRCAACSWRWYYASALTLAGLDLGLIVGMAAGLLSFIPYVGSITGGVTSLGLATAQFPPWRGRDGGGRRAGFGADAGGLRDLSPVPGRSGGIRAVWVIFALFAGAAAFGFLADAGGAGCRHDRGAVPVLAASLPGQPTLSGPATAGAALSRQLSRPRSNMAFASLDRQRAEPAAFVAGLLHRTRTIETIRNSIGLSGPRGWIAAGRRPHRVDWRPLVCIGLLTRPAAFIMSGEMALGYFMFHAPKSPFPLVNGGDAAILYCFIFLYLAFAGGGAWSLDRADRGPPFVACRTRGHVIAR